jgi:KaiC/GvpD/RAD55 family RecA-like ATPase
MLDQLVQPSVSTILVKGHPGTGKSSLVLEMLRMQGKGTYVSTRVSRDNLAMHNPQVSLVVVGGVEKDLRIAETKLNVEDYRLASSAQIVRLVFGKIKEEPGGLIVLDSWDSIAKELTPVERLQTEKTMVSAIQASDSKLVFVSEEPAMTTTDFLVDAIIELGLEFKHGYFRRWIETRKIRGQEITRPKRLFTLKEGKFTILEPLEVKFPGQYQPKQYVALAAEQGRYSSGVKDLDQLMGGGFLPGSIVCLEHGSGIAPYTLLPFDLVIHSNFIASGGGIVLVPSAGISPGMVLGPLRAILPPKLVESSIRLGSFDKLADPCIFAMDEVNDDTTFLSIRNAIDELKGPSKRPCMIELGMDKLEYVHGKREVLKHLSIEMTRARGAGDVFVTTVGDFTEAKGYISAISDTHVIFESINDTLTVQSLKPTTPIMAIGYEYSGGFPKVSFTPIT